jgi:error-prone DNA polymerase
MVFAWIFFIKKTPMKYTELQITTNFTFLQGASHPHELVEEAAALGYSEIGITDCNTLAGIVRSHAAAKKIGIKIIVGCRLDITNGPGLLAYPTDINAYSRLTNLLTTGNLRTEKGKCLLYKEDVYRFSEGMKLIAIPPNVLNDEFDIDTSFKSTLKEYREAFGNNLYLAATRRYHGDDQKQLFRLFELSNEFDIPLIATNDVYYHHPSRRQLQDILTCTREKSTIYNAGYKLYPNAERHLKSQEEILRLFRAYPDAIKRTQEIVQACTFSLDELKYEYPLEIITEGRTPMEEITFLAWKGAKEIFGEPLPKKIINNIKHELAFIKEMNYASYFLTVYDIVREARRRNILCQGRGSAANSTICFCLGITAVNPEKFDLLFERFLSAARNEPPDIDVDFEHERREEIMQYIYEKYGRNRAAIVATVTQQHRKGSLKDVGKAMGLSVDTIEGLTSNVWGYDDEWFEKNGVTHQGLNPADKHLQKTLELANQYMGFPRQLGQHTGGFVITKGKLSDLCPILNARMENRTNIEWNKDDIDALGFLKIDVLALGMLTCIRKAFDLCKQHYGLDLTLANIPQDDPKVYENISHADTIGVFQIESRAQQSMLPRLRPKNFYDLVIEVAIVRPGPIQGDMVHPYLRRRNGEEPVEYPSKELEEILGRTLGVPLFQEQAMKIAIVAAGFTPAEADELRRSMATFKLQGLVSKFEKKLIDGMLKNGYTEEYARRVFRQLEGFGSYGFPESHAASFASLVYVSAWIKTYYPDVFACALLNSMPMGFYQPAQIIIDAKQHGVNILPIDINYSNWDNTLETKTGAWCALRLGFRQIKGVREEDMERLITTRIKPFIGIHELRNIGLTDIALEKLADADAFRSIGLDRREALWKVSAKDIPTSIFKGQTSPEEKGETTTLPQMTPSEHVVQDYATTSLSIKAHPVSFVREKLSLLHVVATKDLSTKKTGDKVKLAGIVLVRQRPGTAKGVCFMTIEDEWGWANAVIFPNLFDKQRKEILQSTLIMLEGKLQVEGEVIHIIVHRCYNISKMLGALSQAQEQLPKLATFAFPDRLPEPTKASGPKERIFPDARNFK